MDDIETWKDYKKSRIRRYIHPKEDGSIQMNYYSQTQGKGQQEAEGELRHAFRPYAKYGRIRKIVLLTV